LFEYHGLVSTGRLASAHRLLQEALDELGAAGGAGASDDELLSMLTVCEGVARRLDRLVVTTVAALQRRGSFAERGYSTPASALGDLLGWERAEARRRVMAAEQVSERVGLDGTALPARLPATAEAFAAGQAGLRHVEVIARLLDAPAAQRLSPPVWAGAEAELAAHAGAYTPSELHAWGSTLIETLDQDGAEPDERPSAQVNELHLTRNRTGGGSLKARFDDAAMFDAVATVLDAKAAPLGGDDHRPTGKRQAEALAEVCGHVLDHGELPETGGRRPHLNVLIRLEDLEQRARAALLDFGGSLTPESLRLLACDAAVIPIVLGGTGQPLDIGRISRTIPDGLRRAVAARDRGCAHPGCGRPASWCEVHHIHPWQDGGDTALHNCVMVCRIHHRLLHHSDWQVRIRDGLPEFIPPAWIDPQRRPRRKALPHLAA
jgi:5-methylcytosine-specific restriction protein A